MRVATAVLSIAVLAVVTAYCPYLVYVSTQPGPAHACCPHSRHGEKQAPCDTTSQTCPYLLLEKGKAIALHGVPAPSQMAVLAPPIEAFERVALLPAYLPDTTGLYLRNRVLLI